MIYGSEYGPTGRKRNKFETIGFYRKGGRMIGRSGVQSYGENGERQARRVIRNKAESGRALVFSTHNLTRRTVRKLNFKNRSMTYPKQKRA